MRLSFAFLSFLVFSFFGLTLRAQDTAADAANSASTQAAAALASGAAKPAAPDFVEHLVDLALAVFGVKSSGNTWQHWAIAGLITVLFYVLRKVVANFVFGFFKRVTARTETTLDDELIVAWQNPVAAIIAVLGTVIAIKVLKLSPEADAAFVYLKTIAFAVVGLWFFINTLSSILDHLHEAAKTKGAAVAAFMPWIKKTVIALFLIFGVLIAAQSLGADVKAFLAGLGIGGLAFALAAQDTLANVFGSVVVAVDQPFRIGEFVQIGAHQGTVEDIGLRSTKLRTPQRSLIVIPNKTVASDAINNFSRMPQRRVDQTIGLTYSAKSHQIEGLLEEIRALLKNDPAVHQDFITVNFLNYGAFSLDIQIIYFAADPDARKTFDLRERINLAIMRMVEERGLNFAFPTQTIEFSGPIAERLAAGRPSA
ncbi:MAG: mechanosensitive ion channel family protein [Verrucomicrobia bacterium]|nr:mechanosensitive ion channel family protein [Verrucomicrobiota bacterium]